MVARERELSALLSSAAIVMVGGIIGSGATLAERVVIGRLLSPDAYGEISVGLALLNVGVTVALVGCTQGVSRYIPRYDAVEDRRGVWISGLLVTTVSSVCLSAVLFLFADPIVSGLFETEAAVPLVRLLAVAIPFVACFRIAVAGIRGHENTIYRTLTRNLLDPLLRIGLLTVLLLSGVGIVAAGVAYLGGAIVTLVVAHAFLSRLMPLRGRYRTHVPELLRFSAPLVVSTVISILLTRTDTLMLGYFRSSYEVGMYDAAYPIAGGLLVVLSAFGFLYLPLVSRLDDDGDRDAVDEIYATTTKWVYVVTFPAFLLLVVFPLDVIHLVFGTAYTDAARVLPILATGFFLSAAAGRNRETLSALGSTTWIAVGNVVGLLLNIGINVALIPRYGAVGAAVASVTSLVAVHTVICSVLAVRYDITPISPEALRCYVALPAVLLPLAFALSPWLSITVVTIGPVLVGVGLASLVVAGLVGGLESNDVVVLDLLEDAAGVSVPMLRRWIPSSGDEDLDAKSPN
ncbi:polysaccharide biosynthesis protein [Natrinema thermotolerans DSM 11552]|uniref:flippase n=1 Tax=unclassified Natrinema TaxID=2622230 RepID=UPI0002AFF516|nr:polysaccharide biosynthesis protein [Natrinema thermotolerans DSM 11552]